MTPSLRQVHRFSWLVLAIALPAGFVAALRVVKPPLTQEPVTQQPPAPLPVLVRSVTTDSLDVTLRRATPGSGQQLELVLKRPFAIPSAVVRVRERAIGLLDAPGVYRFPVTTADNPARIEIVDDLHGRLLRTIQL